MTNKKMAPRMLVLMLLWVCLQTHPIHADSVNADETENTLPNTKLKAIYHKAVALDAAGKYEEAAQRFRELMELTGRLEYHYNIGLCEYSRSRFDLAWESFKQ